MPASLPVSFILSRAKQTVVDSSYHWDNQRRGQGWFLIFQYTFSGCGIFNSDRRETPIPPGHAMVTTSIEKSSYYYPSDAKEPWTFGYMIFTGAEDSWKWLRKNYGSVIALSSHGESISIFRDIITRYDGSGFKDRFHSSELVFQFLMAVFRELTASAQRKDSGIHYVRHYIDDHHQRPLSVKELAAKADLSREHFSRLFTTTIGQSPAAYLRERRLQTAELLLKQTVESVQEISRLSGFSSASHFCPAFRERKGCSPESFRRH